MIDVYVKTDENGIVVNVNSSVFIEPTENWVKIDSGYGEKFIHAQSQYLQLIDENEKFNYKLVGGKLILLSDDEKNNFFPDPEILPTKEEIQNDLNVDFDFRITCLELGL